MKKWKILIFALATLFHLILIYTVTLNTGEKKTRKDTSIFKVVDVEEYITPEPIKEPPKPLPIPKIVIPEEEVEVAQDDISEDVIETEKEVVKVEHEPAIVFLPQHKISNPPGIPTKDILDKIIYPALANKQKIEGVVYLELYIDQVGNIRDIKVLKDPGFGLAEAAINAISGIKCTPALANGEPVAVRFRYPVRFRLK